MLAQQVISSVCFDSNQYLVNYHNNQCFLSITIATNIHLTSTLEITYFLKQLDYQTQWPNTQILINAIIQFNSIQYFIFPIIKPK